MRQRNTTLERHPFFWHLRLTAGIPERAVAALPWVAVMQRFRSFASHWKIRLIAPKRSLAFTTA